MDSQLPLRTPSPNVQVPQPQLDQGKLSKALSAVGRFVTAPLRFSLAGRAAWVLFVFLAVLVAVVWFLFKSDPNVVTWQSFMSPWRMAAVVILAVATPVVVYFALRLWLRGDVSRFPDIDYAWKAGLDALEENGIALEDTPIFLILGSTNEGQEKAIVDAAGLRVRVACTPEGPAPLHWYANPDAILLFCTESSLLSALNALQEKSEPISATTVSGHFVNPSPPAPSVLQTSARKQATTPPAAADGQTGNRGGAGQVEGGGDHPTGTIMLDQFLPLDQQQAPPVASSPVEADRGEKLGTVTLPEPVSAAEQTLPSSPSETQTAAGPRQPSRPGPAALDQIAISARDATQQLQRLQYVCHQLRLARQPLCAINGILTLIPFESVLARAATDELKRAIKMDVTTVQRELALRCPVSAMIVGLENERGFRELVRRVGRERATSQRFGRRYDVRAVPTPRELNALSAHVCGAFEDWIYTLFREHGALSRPGNTKLYSLLCKVRCTLKTRLGDVLSSGFGYEEGQATNEVPIPFSGCYFAATGATADRQAFVRGVVDKLLDEQEQVEWTQEAVRRDRRYFRLAAVGIAVNVVLAVALAAMLLSRV